MATLLSAFESALVGNKQVEAADDAIIESGRTIATAIDAILADPEASATEKTKALYLIPHIVSILRELLATPAARKQFSVATGEARGSSRIANIKKNISKG